MQANLKKMKWRPRGRRNQVKAIQKVDSMSEEDEDNEEIEALDIIEVAPFSH